VPCVLSIHDRRHNQHNGTDGYECVITMKFACSRAMHIPVYRGSADQKSIKRHNMVSFYAAILYD
jgi:hypothetical protein